MRSPGNRVAAKAAAVDRVGRAAFSNTETCKIDAEAARWLTGSKRKIGRLRRDVHLYGSIPVVCTYHPAYVRRNPPAEPKAREDLRRLLEQVRG